MASQYHYLVSSLLELHTDGVQRDFDALAIRERVRESLGEADREVLDLFYTWYDVSNLIDVESGSEKWSELGNFTAEELARELREPEGLPDFLARVIKAKNDKDTNTNVDLSHGFAHALYEAYYARTDKSDNRFLREWYEFDRTLRNIGAAVTARRLSLPVEDVLVGEGDVVDSLIRTGGSDPGTGADPAGQLMQILSMGDLWEKEHRLDTLRVQKADAMTVFDYFDMDRVLAYMVKVNLIHRWSVLDPALGAAMLERMLENMKI